jgi:Ca2+-binding EF-hand superfamily protein
MQSRSAPSGSTGGSAVYAPLDEYALVQSFNSVDADGSGSIDARELQRALASGGLVFSLQTVALLIRLNSSNTNGLLSFSEFKAVHEFLSHAHQSFVHFDASRSGKLNKDEVLRALVYGGYGDVDETAIKHACKSFDPDRSNDLGVDQYIGLMLFLHACRRVFKSFDLDKDGKITLDFNQFIYAAVKTR